MSGRIISAFLINRRSKLCQNRKAYPILCTNRNRPNSSWMIKLHKSWLTMDHWMTKWQEKRVNGLIATIAVKHHLRSRVATIKGLRKSESCRSEDWTGTLLIWVQEVDQARTVARMPSTHSQGAGITLRPARKGPQPSCSTLTHRFLGVSRLSSRPILYDH